MGEDFFDFSTSLIVVLIPVIIIWIYVTKFKPFLDLQKKLKSPDHFELYKRVFATPQRDFWDKVCVKFFGEKFDCLWIAHYFCVNIHNPEDVKIVLNSKDCFEKAVLYHEFMKYGLPVEGGEYYKQQRKSLKPIFATTNLKFLTPKINEKVHEYFESCSAKLEGEIKCLKFLMSKFTLCAVFETMYGVKEPNQEEIDDIIMASEQYLQSMNDRMFSPWLFYDVIYRFSSLYEYQKNVWEILDNLLNNREEKDIPYHYLNCMKPILDNMSEEEFLQSIALFSFASYETTAQTLTYALLMLSIYQGEQEKVYNEVSAILYSYEDEVTEDQYNKMNYLEIFIKETLRLFSVAFGILRTADKDIQLTNFVAPKGSIFAISVMAIHRDKSIWGEDALEFRPERFTDESFKDIHPYAYIPFSNGPRMCPGYKYGMIVMKIFLSKFIMKYHVTTSAKFEDVKIVVGITTSLENVPVINITKRQK